MRTATVHGTATAHDTFDETTSGPAAAPACAGPEAASTTALTSAATPEPPPDLHDILRHLLQDHGRTELDMSPCRDRLADLHRFEHYEAQCGLVSVGHAHR